MKENLIAMARAAEKDERLSDGALYGKLANRIERLEKTLHAMTENSDRQMANASPIDAVPDLREALCIILGWYEEIPNDELPGKGVRDAFRLVNEALGVPEK